MSETTINQRLNFLLNALGMKAGPFSRALGVSETTVRNYVDRTSKPSSEILEKIVNTFKQVNLVWLVTGEGEPFLQEAGESAQLHTNKGNSSNNVLGTNYGQSNQNAGTGNPNQHIGDSAASQYITSGTNNLEEKLRTAEETIQLLKSQLQDKERIIQLLSKSEK
jgi:predicted transcriptional regulator